MPEPNRVILLLKFLYEKTDENHEISTRHIKKMFAAQGIEPPVSRTIDADVEDLIASGFPIVRRHNNGQAAFYKIAPRALGSPVIKMLIDAVAASRFLSVQKSRELIELLASLSFDGDRPYLLDELNHIQSIKKAVGGSIRCAGKIFEAILAKKKISYQMVEYSAPYKKLVPHKEGKVYTASPYATIWANDRYYLICHEDERDMIITPRMDHIRKVKILQQDITPTPKKFDIGYYYTSVYRMYGGPEINVTVECENSLIGKFIDRFGTDFERVPVTDHSFTATVKACLGNTFFGWLAQYAGRMRLLGPTEAVEQYKQHLTTALESL